MWANYKREFLYWKSVDLDFVMKDGGVELFEVSYLSFDLAFLVFALEGIAFVVKFFTTAESDLEFYQSALCIYF